MSSPSSTGKSGKRRGTGHKRRPGVLSSKGTKNTQSSKGNSLSAAFNALSVQDGPRREVLGSSSSSTSS